MKTKKLFGPPGTGKTSALLRELETELAAGVPPERIAFVTFTVQARREAVQRVQEKFNFPYERLPYFRTLHSVAFRQLGLPRHAMVTKPKLVHLEQQTSLDFGRPQAEEEDFLMGGYHGGNNPLGQQLLGFDHMWRHAECGFEDALAVTEIDAHPRVFKYFTDAYAQWKDEEGLHDFTDLLAMVRNPIDVDVFFVDEAQDLSPLQWRAVSILSALSERRYIAGDDDQAVFTWAGASPQHFIDLPSDETIVLGKSWRVPRRVHRIAESIVHRVAHRQPKDWEPREEEGEVISMEYVDDWEPHNQGTTLILYRNHYLSTQFEHRLRELGVPFKRLGADETSVSKWAPAITAWERRRQRGGHLNEGEREAVQRALMPDRVVDTSMPWFDALTRISPRDGQYLRSVVARFGGKGLTQPPSVLLSTIHAAKGGEADHVVLHVDMSRKCQNAIHEGDDEARVAYVGVTRTKQTLTVLGGDHLLIDRHLFT